VRVDLEPPDGFTVIEPPDQTAWVAVEDAEGASGFRANLVVTVEEAAGSSVDELTDTALAFQERVLAAHHLIDRSTETLAGSPATRTLSHHLVAETGIALEQWRVVAGDRGVTLTASCATLDWPALADDLAAAAGTLRVQT